MTTINKNHKNWTKWGFIDDNKINDEEWSKVWCEKLAMEIFKIEPCQQMIDDLLSMFSQQDLNIFSSKKEKYIMYRECISSLYLFEERIVPQISVKNTLLYASKSDFSCLEIIRDFNAFCYPYISFCKWMSENITSKRFMLLIEVDFLSPSDFQEDLLYEKLKNEKVKKIELFKSKMWKHTYNVLMGFIPPIYFNTTPGVYEVMKDLIGYKILIGPKNIKCIATVLVPVQSTIVVSTMNLEKLRCNKYIILKIEDKYGNDYLCGTSPWMEKLYKVNQTYKLSNLNTNIDELCVPGLYFFGNFHEAVQYLNLL